MDQPVTLDIVLPFYHPHPHWVEHVTESVAALKNRFAGKNITISVYMSNDGGDLSGYPEESLDRIREAAEGRFTFLTYSPNHGKGYSLRYAVARTSGDYQIYTDGDFPFGWEPVALACELLMSGADVVMGVRGRDYSGKLSFLRKYLSRGVRVMNRLLLGMPSEYLDTQAGFKGFNAAGKEQFLKTTVDTFVFDTEFILRAWKNHLKIAPMPIALRPGLSFSKMGFAVMIRELMHFLRFLWQIRILQRY